MSHCLSPLKRKASSRLRGLCALSAWGPAPWLSTQEIWVGQPMHPPLGLPPEAPKSWGVDANPRFTNNSTGYGSAKHLDTEMTGSTRRNQRERL